MRSLVLALVLVAGCDHGGDAPYSMPFCVDSAPSSVVPCPGNPTSRSMDLHVVAATCTDANLSGGCQVDTRATYAIAICVDSCAAIKTDPNVAHSAAELEAAGVHLCQPLAYRGLGGWCATCDSLDLSLAYGYSDPSQGGYWDPVLCVRSCDACAPYSP